MTTLKDHFHLTKDVFTIDPISPEDAGVYFGRQPVEQRLIDRMQMDFASRNVPKFFIFGRYGAGKTHTLAHLRHVLASDQFADFPATEPLLTSLPPMRSKDTWVKLHEHFIDVIGRSRVKDAVLAVVGNSASTDPVEAIFEAGVLQYGDASLQESQAQIFRALIFRGVQETKAWEWLKGKALSADDAAMLETQTNLTTVPDFVNALLNVARLVAIGLEKKIVLLIDEAEVIGSVRNDDSVDEFRHAFRELAEDKNSDLGFITAFQMEASAMAESEVFSYDAISSRLGFEAAYIDLADLVFDDEDAKEFIYRVLAHLVDQEAAAKEIEDHGLATDPSAFPFTPDAIDRIADFVMEDPDRRSPRQIISRMRDAVGKAWLRDRSSTDIGLIDEELVEEILFPDEG
ncbi:hypothetical protein ACE2AJ_14605 [Aquihabitans daechungensis]|uniref:hypothetical protein n=1 Tax=Aquihabitans daechungensis TaxID=1052257 RepID=UPI003B9E2929